MTTESFRMAPIPDPSAFVGSALHYDKEVAERQREALAALQETVAIGGNEAVACQQAGLALGLQPVILDSWQEDYLHGTTVHELPGYEVNDPQFMESQVQQYAKSQTPYGADAGFRRADLVTAAHDKDNPNRAAAAEFLRDFMTSERRARAVFAVTRVGTMVPDAENSTLITVYTPDGRVQRFHNSNPSTLRKFLTERGYREAKAGEPSPIEVRIADEYGLDQLVTTIQDVRRISSRVVA